MMVLRTVALVGCVLAATLTPASAKLAMKSLRSYVDEAELIVVAHVEAVHNDPFDGRRYATARVTETWKGASLPTVTFLASPTWSCDVSTAVVGERAVLFLKRVETSQSLALVHAGHGRMPVRRLHGVPSVRPSMLAVTDELDSPGDPVGGHRVLEQISLVDLRRVISALQSAPSLDPTAQPN